MYISFRPDPPVSPSGMKWMRSNASHPYGPFQPVASLPTANAAQPGFFECDRTLWNLWVEFHQKMRPTFAFPALDCTPNSLLMKHAADCTDRCAAFTDFGRRLTEHLHLTGVIEVPQDVPPGEQWVFVSAFLRDQWPTCMDGPMREEKMWKCMVYELTLFYARLVARKKDLSELSNAGMLWHRVKSQLQSAISWIQSPDPSHRTHGSSPWTSDEPSSIVLDSGLHQAEGRGYEPHVPRSIVRQRITRSRTSLGGHT
ncbi:hypothetical protein C8R47DRAFT_1063741 [Mycena vitilis]|nr:hypothetical protein C8R47DRAFT_1063741 [Mycena vitilis]